MADFVERIGKVVGYDKKGNAKVVPLQINDFSLPRRESLPSPRQVVLRGSATNNYEIGTMVSYQITETGRYVDFAEQYDPVQPNAQVPPVRETRGPTIDLVVIDTHHSDCLIFGRWKPEQAPTLEMRHDSYYLGTMFERDCAGWSGLRANLPTDLPDDLRQKAVDGEKMGFIRGDLFDIVTSPDSRRAQQVESAIKRALSSAIKNNLY